jgi:hypothetical protein
MPGKNRIFSFITFSGGRSGKGLLDMTRTNSFHYKEWKHIFRPKVAGYPTQSPLTMWLETALHFSCVLYLVWFPFVFIVLCAYYFLAPAKKGRQA